MKRKQFSGILFLSLMSIGHIKAQQIYPPTYPINGVSDKWVNCYAFTNATIVTDAQHKINNGTLVIRKGKIEGVGSSVSIPKDAVVIDCNGKFIYPSMIDIYSDYGIPKAQQSGGRGMDFRAPSQIESNEKGAFGWNQAIRTDVDASTIFVSDDASASKLRNVGFGTVLSHQKDGIMRGTGVVATLANEKANLVILKTEASAHYSLNKGTSRQSYPSSMMGSIALIRQTYLDAKWYKGNPTAEGVNITLKDFNNQQNVPQIFDANDKWNVLRADKIGDEFGIQYVIKAGGNEYQRMEEMKATNATFILPLNFPEAMDVEDPNDAQMVSLADMKNWELAPTEPGVFEKYGIKFALTGADIKNPKDFMANLQKAISYGLSDTSALSALTRVPAQILGIYDKVGSLEIGKVANFLITSGPIFDDKTILFQNWIQGDKYDVKNDLFNSIVGKYKLSIDNNSVILNVNSESSATIIQGTDTIPTKFSANGKFVKLSFPLTKKSKSNAIIGGVIDGLTWQGNGTDTAGNNILWTAIKVDSIPSKKVLRQRKENLDLGKLTYPLNGYGWDSLPKQGNVLFKNATVWTNEKEGILKETDVLVKNGKIAAIGKNLSDGGAKVIDGTGKYLSPGIIDEHSHIATSSINEGGQSVTSEVRIGDNMNPDDINIYYQLAGGVTTSHILHGSANTIGGQNQLIKMRWGQDAEGIKYAGADRFIKFALGENVKRTRMNNNNRFPNTRMGVEQVLADAFQRAADYQKELNGPNGKNVRRDLELDALVDIMNKKLFITSHSYVQSELLAAMRVSDKYGFHYNTFTHVLEGYKVADEFVKYGVNAATFSDWWAYKLEVKDAIAYNAAIMAKKGVNVSINSDDAEQARRLNQEAAKTIKYGGMSEEEAFKMVTLNPAKTLHIDKETGSIKVGKSADLVLWTDNPLSIYAKPEETMVDGIIYFDKDRDLALRKYIQNERKRLINKLINAKKSGATMTAARPPMPVSMDEDFD
ncbi:amidohydrolase family protein [Rhizosphaericola mali]|uniref:Amidohydrolase family protein n=1 Tax=Rhizosphaericola mali TaxID=2545455 RepID=A0A5P2FV20_9BACT|nr:amidohydrolase family protein [Rhizosphaericola mali]QES87314.1 amidohydrolase family protein [Rhizosphaericola mali]